MMSIFGSALFKVDGMMYLYVFLANSRRTLGT